jgi:ABC-type bacteriocin/lantibiotic exporter with double-glycine peptidase domain
VVALVGPTGVGKSTFVSLIPRFYDVTAGAIYLDGKIFASCRYRICAVRSVLCCRMSFCFTAPYAKTSCLAIQPPHEEEIIAAAQIANAHEFHSSPAFWL